MNAKDRIAYTHPEVLAALCVWEEMLAKRCRDKTMTPFMRAWDLGGSGAMRGHAVDVGRWIESLFVGAPGDLADPMNALCDKYPFDWEVVPALVDIVAWGQWSGWTAPSGTPAEIAARVAESLNAGAGRASHNQEG